VSTIADLLDPAERHALERLADPNPHLAEAARAAAADSAGPGRVAWACVALVLDKTQTPEEARALLAGMVEDERIRNTALACLAALTGDGDTTTETT
jgi:hypothetical protein